MTPSTLHSIQAEFPHICAGSECAVCAFVRRKWFFERSSKETTC
jgi:hypothetical protein